MALHPCPTCGKPKHRCHTKPPRRNNPRRNRNLARKWLRIIYTQHQGICWICGTPTLPPGQRPRSKHAASIDHIIPISKGGTDHPTNLTLAHYGCNSTRGDDF